MTTVLSWWLSLQHDWNEGFVNKEKVWVSAHHINSKTCHSFLKSDGPTDDLFTSKMISEKEVEVTHVESNTTTRFAVPTTSHCVTPHNNPVSLDITTSGALGAVTNGKDVLVFEGASGNLRRTLTGHVADVECLKFFPSNKVLLTGGGDMCLKIWSVEEGYCAATLTGQQPGVTGRHIGHKRGITALDMIERGKNIVSSSLDGTIKLWCCGTQDCLSTISLESGSVNDIQIFNSETGTDNKLLLSVTERGTLTVHSIHDNTVVSQYKHSSELTACTVVSQNIVIAGSSSGDIVTLDIRNTEQPLSVYRRSSYTVTSLCRDNATQRVWCGQRDGECYSINPTESTLLCDTTLSGSDCEPIYCVVAKGGCVMTSAKDRVIRRYGLV